jgi:membrane carboxypeptidase/penicillin-binding protein PbpC
MIDMGRKMGITTWENPENYGLSLTLGGGEVKLIDLTRVYATLANQGIKPQITSVLKITDYKGDVLEEYKCGSEKEQNTQIANTKSTVIEQVLASKSAEITLETKPSTCAGEDVLDSRVAYIITDILHDNNARSPSFGSNSLLVIPDHKEVAVKTGTSNDLRDNLAVGYNQDYVVAVWVGNNNNTPMARIASGVTGATPIWNKIMSTLLSKQSNHDWSIPEGLIKLPICPYTGTLACSGCPVKPEWFLEESKPNSTCKSEWFDNDEDFEDDEGVNNDKDNKNERDNRFPNSGWVIDRMLLDRFGNPKKNQNQD